MYAHARPTTQARGTNYAHHDPQYRTRREALRTLAAGALTLAGVGALAARTRAERAQPSPRTAPGRSSTATDRTTRVYYSPDYVLAGYSFETTRKAGWVAESLHHAPLPGLHLTAPSALTEAEVASVHAARYVEAVRTGQPRELAQSQGFTWDPGLWPMVLASNGGAVDAARAALADGVSGSLSSGLHHARHERGSGFCTFNGLALAARAALAAGAGRVLILDLDAHCGGGTHSLIADDQAIWQVDVAVNGFDAYAPAARNTLDLVRTPADYLPTIEARLAELPTRAPTFDLCLYNAGMDPHEGCPVGGMRGITREIIDARERMVFDWCRRQSLPVAFVLAGGYTGPALDQAGLVDLHRLTLSAALDRA